MRVGQYTMLSATIGTARFWSDVRWCYVLTVMFRQTLLTRILIWSGRLYNLLPVMKPRQGSALIPQILEQPRALHLVISQLSYLRDDGVYCNRIANTESCY